MKNADKQSFFLGYAIWDLQSALKKYAPAVGGWTPTSHIADLNKTFCGLSFPCALCLWFKMITADHALPPDR